MANFHCHGKIYEFDMRSCYLFKAHWPFRKFCVWLATWKWFKRFILLVIIVNSIVLATYNYEYRITRTEADDDPKNVWHKTIAVVISFIYIAEFLLSVIAKGFFVTENSYLRNGWNRFDFFIVIVCIVDLFLRDTDALIILRNLRLLKPFRSLDMMPQSKEMVNTLI